MRCCCVLRLILPLCLVTYVEAIDCSDVPTSKPNELVQFLKTQARDADPECVPMTMATPVASTGTKRQVRQRQI